MSNEEFERRIAANLDSVVDIARNYSGRGVPVLDLVQAGNLGLIVAANKYSDKDDDKFAALAKWWIRNYIIKEFRNRRET